MITVENKVNGFNELSKRYGYQIAQTAVATKSFVWNARRRFR
ncbi:MAG TPA: hypothetical protein VKN36_15545 [Eudoraea sp.]|nr:hypothetical protein [Eudoraea sp.]